VAARASRQLARHREGAQAMSGKDIICLRWSLLGRRFFLRVWWPDVRRVAWLPAVLVGCAERMR
jgi:hypothetical protein